MALLSNIDELKAYDKVAGTMNVSTILPYIEAAERSYIKEVLGAAQYNDLHTAYLNSIDDTSPTPLDQEDIDLLHECRRALVQLTLHMAAETLAVNVSSTGIKRSESGDSKSAYQYQELAWKRSKLELGLKFLDNLDEFLLENIADYPIYAASAAYTKRFEFLIQSTDSFNDYTALAINRYTYRKLFPIMRQCENGILSRTVGSTLLSTVRTQLNSDSLTTENAALLEKMRSAIVNYSLAKAMKQLSVKVDQLGITVFEDSDKRTIDARKAQDIARMNDLISEFSAEAEAYFRDLEDATYTSSEEETDSRTFLDTGSGGWSAL